MECEVWCYGIAEKMALIISLSDGYVCLNINPANGHVQDVFAFSNGVKQGHTTPHLFRHSVIR